MVDFNTGTEVKACLALINQRLAADFTDIAAAVGRLLGRYEAARYDAEHYRQLYQSACLELGRPVKDENDGQE